MENEIAALVDFWAGYLPRQTVHNNGDGVASLMMTLVASSGPGVTPEQITRFRESLTELLTDATKTSDSSLYVGTDYAPELLLADACRAAGIIGWHSLPCKTRSWISPGEVTVAEGYGGSLRVIYPLRGERSNA